MHCWKCGAEIRLESKYCHNCGQQVELNDLQSGKHTKPKNWFTILFLFLVGLIVVAAYFQLTKEDLDKIITKQMDAIKSKHFTEAYYEYTTKDFQHSTSLEVYRDFIKNNPVFGENGSIEFLSTDVDNQVGTVKAILTAKSGEKAEVLYHLVDENDAWKIQFIHIEDNAESKSPPVSKQHQELFIPIDKQLKALQAKDFTGAYEGLVSKDFLQQTPIDRFKAFIGQYPILTNFYQYGFENPKVDGAQADVVIILNPGQENIPLKYKLINEEGSWKIWGIQIVLPAYGGAANSIMHPKELAPAVQKLLQALQSKKIDEAYNELTTKEFKRITDLKSFKAFVERFPLLSTYTSYTIKDALIENDQHGRATADLKKDGEAVEMLFGLELEDNVWKIQGIQEVVDQAKAATKPPVQQTDDENAMRMELVSVIQKLLQAIRESKLKVAYDDYTSAVLFQKTVPFDKFEEYVRNTPVFNMDYKAAFSDFTFSDNFASASGVLTVDEKARYPIDFRLAREHNTWKIFHIEVKPVESIPEVKEKEPSQPKEEPKLSFGKILISPDIDNEGNVQAPSTRFTPQAGNLYVNVFVENGQPGDNIELAIKHLGTDEQTPHVSLTLSEKGNSTEVFYFSPPSEEWSEGEYELKAVSSKGASLQIPFQVIQRA